MIELNRAVAHGYAFGPAAGLALLAEARAGGALDDYPHAVAAEADLTARDGGPRARGRALPAGGRERTHSDPSGQALSSAPPPSDPRQSTTSHASPSASFRPRDPLGLGLEVGARDPPQALLPIA